MQGKVFLVSTGYDPALGREVRDPTLEGAMSGDAADVVAELDRWLDNSNDHTTAIERRVVLRARQEIVGLRGLLEHSDRTVITAVAVATPAIRAEALEEAAQLAHANGFGETAAAIRALKEKGHD